MDWVVLSAEQLKMFVAAAETGSFSAASRHLGKVQSAVSTGIANLEIDLGFSLFDRETRKPGLTENGVRLMPHARAVLAQVDNLQVAAESLFAGEETSLRIALDDALLVPAFHTLLVALGASFPATQVEVLTEASPEIAQIVAEGRADIGVMFSAGDMQKNLEQVLIGNLPFFSVSAPDAPLARMASIGATDLLAHRQILLRSGQGRSLGQFPALSPDVWYASSFHVMKELVLQGAGWTYLPAHMAWVDMADGRLVKLNFRFEHRHWNPPVECVLRRGAAKGPALRWLFVQVKDMLSV